MLETNKQTNKQALLSNFGEDLSYFVILRYKLHDLIKSFDDFVNDSIKGDFQKTVTISDRQEKFGGTQMALAAYTRKSLPCLSFMIDNQAVSCSTFHSCVPYNLYR